MTIWNPGDTLCHFDVILIKLGALRRHYFLPASKCRHQKSERSELHQVLIGCMDWYMFTLCFLIVLFSLAEFIFFV